MSKWDGPYVSHTCRFCGCAFVAEDYTHVKDTSPTWRACPQCCKERGIDYNIQKPNMYRTPEQLQKIKERTERLRAGLQKAKMSL